MTDLKLIKCDDDGGECVEHSGHHYGVEGLKYGEELHMKDVSDGHHTFRELYAHRLALTVALARSGAAKAWLSLQHHPDDGSMFDGDFIVGIELSTGTIRYHYNLEFLELFDGIRILPHAPKWDGAGPEQTIERLLAYRAGWKVFS